MIQLSVDWLNIIHEHLDDYIAPDCTMYEQDGYVNADSIEIVRSDVLADLMETGLTIDSIELNEDHTGCFISFKIPESNDEKTSIY